MAKKEKSEEEVLENSADTAIAEEPVIWLTAKEFFYFEENLAGVWHKFYCKPGDVIKEPRHVKALMDSAHMAKLQMEVVG